MKTSLAIKILNLLMDKHGDTELVCVRASQDGIRELSKIECIGIGQDLETHGKRTCIFMYPSDENMLAFTVANKPVVK